MNVSTLISSYLDAQQGFLEPSTIRWWHYYLKPLDEHLGERAISSITISDLRHLFATLIQENDYQPYTRFNFVRAWKRLFKWAVEEDLLDENPAARLRRPPLPEHSPAGIDENDVKKLLDEAGRTSTPERDQAIIWFLLETGARLGGVAHLRMEYLNLEQRRAIVQEKGRNGKKERTVFFGPSTQQALERWLAIRPQQALRRERFADRVFLLSESGIYQLLKRLAHRADISGRWNPHAFRHQFARRLLAKGASVGVVSHLMGHSNVQVTIDYYGRFSEQELQQIYNSLLDK